MLEGHHSRPVYRLGMSWQSWKGGKHTGYGKGHYWRGAWSSAAGQPAKDKFEPQFPTYDSVAIAKSKPHRGYGKGKAAEDADMTNPDDTLVATIQDEVNQTRRAEQKVRQLNSTKAKREEQWNTWLEALRKTYLKEFAKYRKDMEKLNDELHTALQVQEEARASLRNVHHKERIDQESGADDAAWERLTQQWHKERQEENDPAAVLRRAFVSGIPPDTGASGPPRQLHPDLAAFLQAMGAMAPGARSMQCTEAAVQPPATGVVAEPRAYNTMSPVPGPPRTPTEARSKVEIPEPAPTSGLVAEGAPQQAVREAVPVVPRTTSPHQLHASESKETMDSQLKHRQSIKTLPGGVARTTSPASQLATKLEQKRAKELAQMGQAPTGSAVPTGTTAQGTVIDDDSDIDLLDSGQTASPGLTGLE